MKKYSGIIIMFIGIIVIFCLSFLLKSEENAIISLIKLSPGILVTTIGLIFDIKEQDEHT